MRAVPAFFLVVLFFRFCAPLDFFAVSLAFEVAPDTLLFFLCGALAGGLPLAAAVTVVVREDTAFLFFVEPVVVVVVVVILVVVFLAMVLGVLGRPFALSPILGAPVVPLKTFMRRPKISFMAAGFFLFPLLETGLSFLLVQLLVGLFFAVLAHDAFAYKETRRGSTRTGIRIAMRAGESYVKHEPKFQ